MERKHRKMSLSESDTKYLDDEGLSDLKPLVPDMNSNYIINFKPSNSWTNAARNIKYTLTHMFNTDFKRFFLIHEDKLYILGKEFYCRPPYKSIYKQAKKELKDIIWVTYRAEFRPIPRKLKNIDWQTDSGWGCTIRVGQMLFLNTLRRHFGLFREDTYKIIKIIEENLENAPFSIHKIIEISSNEPGEWFSPCSISHVLVDLLKNFPISRFQMQVCMDNMICVDQIIASSTDESLESIRNCCCCLGTSNENICINCEKPIVDFKWKNSVLIFLPIMLGREKIQKEYFKVFEYFIKNEFSVGIIGGKPRSALYLVGIKGKSVIVLDPHYVQAANKTLLEFKQNLHTYYCENFIYLPLSSLESSLNVGIFIQSKEDLRVFLADLKTNPSVEGFITVKSRTPDYLLEDSLSYTENEEGFIVFE